PEHRGLRPCTPAATLRHPFRPPVRLPSLAPRIARAEGGMADGPETVAEDGGAAWDRLRSLAGLEFLQGMLEGRLPGPPIAATLGFALRSVGPGRVVFAGTPQALAMNPLGSLHGGWYGAALDSAMACAVHSLLPRGAAYT